MSIVNFSRNGGWNGKGFDHHPSFEYNPQRIYRAWNVPAEVLTSPAATGADQLYPRPTKPSEQLAGKSRERRELEAEILAGGTWDQ